MHIAHGHVWNELEVGLIFALLGVGHEAYLRDENTPLEVGWAENFYYALLSSLPLSYITRHDC